MSNNNIIDNQCKWPVYRVYGHNFASDFPFSSNLPEAKGNPDLTFTCTTEAPVNEKKSLPILYSSSKHDKKGESVFTMLRGNDYILMHYTGITDFYLWPDRIICHLLNINYKYKVELILLGGIFSVWLELKGIPVLHASTVAVDGKAVSFLNYSGGGKSSITGSLIKAGYPLLTDDILPVQNLNGSFIGQPGYSQINLWPEEVRHILGSSKNLEKINPKISKLRVRVGPPDGIGTFSSHYLPLSCFYIMERCNLGNKSTSVDFLPVSPMDAVLELVRYSFAIKLIKSISDQQKRLSFLANMADHTPIRRVNYPDGLEHLEQVCQDILKDQEKLKNT